MVAIGAVSWPDMIFKQRLALPGVGAFVDEGLALAPPLVDGPRPLKHAAHCEAVQLHVAIVAFLDAE